MKIRISFGMRMGREVFRLKVGIGGDTRMRGWMRCSAEAAASSDRAVRKKDYVEVQQILAEELPGIPLWYPNNEVVHTRRIVNVRPRASGNFDFLARGRSYRRCARSRLCLLGLPERDGGAGWIAE